MSDKSLHEKIQERALKILNWTIFAIGLVVTPVLFKTGNSIQAYSALGMSGAVSLSLLALYNNRYNTSVYITLSGVAFAVTLGSFQHTFNLMGIYELVALVSIVSVLACLLVRQRGIILIVGIYNTCMTFIYNFIAQPPALRKSISPELLASQTVNGINIKDSVISIITVAFILVLSDQIFSLTGELITHFKREENFNNMQRKQLGLIVEHSGSGLKSSSKLREQAIIGTDTTQSLQDTIQNFLENMHTMDSSIKDFISRNEGISEAAGNIMDVFTKHRDGLEGYRSKTATISESSQEIDFITQSKRSQLNDLIVVTQDGEERMQKSVGAIEKVAENSKDMLNMISLIMEVAERTNVLALNAAVEASRAGKAGGGFAIVAKEIKKLSTETTQNADTINRSLRLNIKSIEEAVDIIRHAGDSFIGINSGLSEFSIAIDDIVNRVNALTEQNIQMSVETKDVLILVDEVQQVLEKMLIAIEQSTSKVLNIQSSSKSLETNMKDLQKHTNVMRHATTNIQEIYKDYSYSATRIGEIVDEINELNSTSQQK